MGDSLSRPSSKTPHDMSIDDRYIEIDGVKMDRKGSQP